MAGVLALLAAAVAIFWWQRNADSESPLERTEISRVAVEVAPVTTGSIHDVREFTGTLEDGDFFTVAPKIGGQVEQVHVDIGDRVTQGQIVVELDDDLARLAVTEAEAELAVAEAEVRQAQADAELAANVFERTRMLADSNMVPKSELDTARAQARAQRAAVAVAEARVQQREAALENAQVQLGHTDVRADWPGDDPSRVIGARMVNAGDTVAARTPLLSVVGLTPLSAAVYVPGRDYPALREGQLVQVSTDALPDRTFDATIERIAPLFEPGSRRARVEIRVPNTDLALRPGMFVTVRVTVNRANGVTLVPREALVQRDSQPGVYQVVEGEPPTVRFVPVDVGIESERRVQILSPRLGGRVVTLGQQMLEDDVPVIVSELPAS